MQESIAVIGTIVVGVAGIGISLLEYHRRSREKEKANEIVSSVLVLKSILHHYLESTKLVIGRYEIEKKGKTPNSQIGDFQWAYKKTLLLTRDMIKGLFQNASIVYLFPPGSRLFNLLSNMLFLLEPYADKTDSFLGPNGELKIPEPLIITCVHCLGELSHLDSKTLEHRVREKMRDFTDIQEIEVIKQAQEALKDTTTLGEIIFK